jgi:hypothetical protein
MSYAEKLMIFVMIIIILSFLMLIGSGNVEFAKPKKTRSNSEVVSPSSPARYNRQCWACKGWGKIGGISCRTCGGTGRLRK